MKKHVHFLGIGGSGASAAAAIAQAQDFKVDGCDLEPNNEFTLHIPCVKYKGHSASHLTSGNVDILAVTPAIYSLDPHNPELMEAKKKKIPIITWQKFTGKYLMKNKFVIAVAGTHGKTTATAMIAKILEDAGLDPTVLLGAINQTWKANFRVGHGKYFVLEADEYNDNFLAFTPDISVVTNIEMDHPEYFKDFEHYKKSFEKFLSQTKGQVVDKPNNLIDFPLQIPGEFNRLNACLAFEVGLLLNINPKLIQSSLQKYRGVSRRFEYLGEYKGAKVYSDFGHHPTEIKETMQAAREKFPKARIWLIYEPHMFTRTKALFADFVKVFRDIRVDKIIITDIYQSREVDKGLVNSQQLAEAVNKENTIYISKKQLNAKLQNELGENAVVFFMGAGEADKIAKQLLRS